MPSLVNITLTIESGNIPTTPPHTVGVIDLYTGNFVQGGQTAQVKYDNTNLTLLAQPIADYGFEVSRWEFIAGDFTMTGTSTPVVGASPLPDGATATLKLWRATKPPTPPGTPAPPSMYATQTMSNYAATPQVSTTTEDGLFSISYSVPSRALRRRGNFAISYTVSVPVIPAENLRYQNVKTGEEVWQLLLSEVGNLHFINYRLRYFAARGGYLWFLLVSHDEFSEQDVKVRLVRYDYVTNTWEVRGEVSFGALRDVAGSPPAYPSFGCVAEGHNGIVYANNVGAVYFPYDDNLEPILIPLFSSTFSPATTEWLQIAVLVVPEGFLFLPHGILWDFDVFYDIPVDMSLSSGDRLIPVYLENTAGVIVRSKEYPYSPASSIKAFYVWGGLEQGLIRGQVGVASHLSGAQPNPIYLGGTQLANQWYAFNAYPHWDESTILIYDIQKSSSNPEDKKQWKWTLQHKLFALPLPFGAPIKHAPLLPPGWGEIWYFSVGANYHYAYFARMFDRIYRLRASDKRLSLAHNIPYLDFQNNIIPRFSGVEPAILLFSFNSDDGRVYACHVRSGGRIQVWRQSSEVTPPLPPTILFPHDDIAVPRQFELIFRPAVDERPQEFSVAFTVTTSWGKQHYTYYSHLHRELFQVSTDAGATYYPMSGAVVVSDENTYIKFTLPFPLPAGSEVTVTVTSYAIE